jgi:hypothetical protein
MDLEVPASYPGIPARSAVAAVTKFWSQHCCDRDPRIYGQTSVCVLSPMDGVALAPQIVTSSQFCQSRNSVRRKGVGRLQVGPAFFHQTLSLEILHERIYRLVRYAQGVRHVSDPQFSGIKDG